jgi:hypothetical protein
MMPMTATFMLAVQRAGERLMTSFELFLTTHPFLQSAPISPNVESLTDCNSNEAWYQTSPVTAMIS